MSKYHFGPYKHRESKNKTPLYKRWIYMKVRCRKSPSYVRKGIQICEEWQKFKNFEKWALANGYEESLTLDRINSDGHYSPDNCRWVTQSENSKNKSGPYHNSGT